MSVTLIHICIVEESSLESRSGYYDKMDKVNMSCIDKSIVKHVQANEQHFSIHTTVLCGLWVLSCTSGIIKTKTNQDQVRQGQMLNKYHIVKIISIYVAHTGLYKSCTQL